MVQGCQIESYVVNSLIPTHCTPQRQNYGIAAFTEMFCKSELLPPTPCRNVYDSCMAGLQGVEP